jgi:hypothetical protein
MPWKLTTTAPVTLSPEPFAPAINRYPAGSIFVSAESTSNPDVKKVTTESGKVGYVPSKLLVEV